LSVDGRDSADQLDPHTLLFGDDEFDGDVHAYPSSSRRQERRDRGRRRRNRLLTSIGVLFVLVVAGAAYFGYSASVSAKDFSGSGSGSITVQVHSGDGADAIGGTLQSTGVVASKRAFTNAASGNGGADNIQPGFYRLRKGMSAQSALSMLLDPTSQVVEKVTIPEGRTEQDVVGLVATALNVPVDQVSAVAKNLAALDLPGGYGPTATGSPTTAEGFFFPATYSFDPGTKPAVALQMITAQFVQEDRKIGFAGNAKTVGITPYQGLIIASIAQAEVKFPADAPKVARVILNRLAINKPLQIDATSVYGAELLGLDLSKVTYSQLDSPYNSYTHNGLPPTPIGNPGETMLQAAVAPAAGDWLYYVNSDAQGHLFFTNSEAAFATAAAACAQNHWGCG